METNNRQFRRNFRRGLLSAPAVVLVALSFAALHRFSLQNTVKVDGASPEVVAAANDQFNRHSVLGLQVAKPAVSPSPAPAAAAAATATAAKPSKTAAASPAPAPTPTPVSGSGDYASETTCPGQASAAAAPTVLVCLTTYARAQHGAGAVTGNSALMAAATAKAQDIINCGFSHTACGHPFDYWMKAKGFAANCSGENIAQGQATPIAVFTAWMNSAGHRANILNASYKSIGVAGTASPAGIVWVMELGGC